MPYASQHPHARNSLRARFIACIPPCMTMQLRQIEEEASFDIGIRHERRYGKLERMVSARYAAMVCQAFS